MPSTTIQDDTLVTGSESLPMVQGASSNTPGELEDRAGVRSQLPSATGTYVRLMFMSRCSTPDSSQHMTQASRTIRPVTLD
jgi:hypothetical protein